MGPVGWDRGLDLDQGLTIKRLSQNRDNLDQKSLKAYLYIRINQIRIYVWKRSDLINAKTGSETDEVRLQ